MVTLSGIHRMLWSCLYHLLRKLFVWCGTSRLNTFVFVIGLRSEETGKGFAFVIGYKMTRVEDLKSTKKSHKL